MTELRDDISREEIDQVVQEIAAAIGARPATVEGAIRCIAPVPEPMTPEQERDPHYELKRRFTDRHRVRWGRV